jgi:hypothetical protein
MVTIPQEIVMSYQKMLAYTISEVLGYRALLYALVCDLSLYQLISESINLHVAG